MPALIALIAVLVELVFAYPDVLQRTIGHPVQWMGGLIGFWDRQWNDDRATPAERRRAGVIMLAVLLGLTFAVSLIVTVLLHRLPFGWAVEAVLASSLVAGRQLADAVRAVADGLDASLVRGRQAVAGIVGRDTAELDEGEVSRAAIETLAENASDGVVAPVFWLLVFGLPGIALYKAVNTADSMIGHRNARYADFGWASAKLDDLVNWIPARITAYFFCLAATLVPAANPGHAWQAIWRDAHKHASPNAGWPEAAMGGALGFALGGPRAYAGEVVDLPVMGQGKRHLEAADIRKALGFYWTAGALGLALIALGAIVFA